MLTKELTGCYGCRACEQVCPVSAITMRPNREGFIFPDLDLAKCIDCDRCNSVCSLEKTNLEHIFHREDPAVYAAWNKCRDKLAESTSGGLFAVIAEYVLSQGGIVYGCAWKNEELIARHIRIESREELIRLKGSKYVQSDINGCYKEAATDLRNGRTVLFSGTPCQIAGLRLFLRKPYDNLFTIDLVCHGVPSPLMFRKYIEWLENKRNCNITEFKFRDRKKNDPRAYNTWIENGQRKQFCLSGLQPYFYGFNGSYFNRESCFTCSFSTDRRVGDITLSDYWGGEKHHPELVDARKHGYNLVMCNTPKGEQLFDAVRESVNLIRSKAEYAIEGDIRLRCPDDRPAFRDSVYGLLETRGFDYLAKHHLRHPLHFIHKLTPLWVKNIIRRLWKMIARK